MTEYDVVVIGVFEAHVIENDFTLRIDEFLCIRAVKDFNVSIHDLQETFNPCHAPLELLGKFNNPAYRGDQRCHIEDIRDQIPWLDLAVYQENASGCEHDQEHEALKQPDRNLKRGHVAVGVPLHGEESPVLPVELVLFELFVCECFDDFLAKEAVLYPGVEFTRLMPLVRKGPPHFKILADAYEGHNRDDGKYAERERNMDADEDYKGDQRFEPRYEELFRTVVGKFRHVKEVIGDAAHDLPDFGIVVVGRGQAQEMGVRVAAHIGLDIGSHHMPLISHVICREAVDDTKDQIQKRQLRHDFQCKRFQALHAGICQVAYDHRERQLRQAGKACAGQILCDRCFVFAVIGQKTPHEFSA